MTKLTDTQAILLSTAAQRADGSLLPPPETIGANTNRIRKAVGTLIKRALADEVEVTTANRAWRSQGEMHWGAVITDAGRAAIGVEPSGGAGERLSSEAPSITEPAAADTTAAETSAPGMPPSESRQTKGALVLAMLSRDQGATLTELVAATGWLPHTTRAALTGLRKKGHDIAKGKRDEVTCYRMASAA